MIKAYRELDKSPREWMLVRVLPAAGIASAVSVFLILLLPDIFLSTISFVLLMMMIGFITLSAVVWPLAMWERRRREIDDEIHLFILRVGVLSLASSARGSIFEIATKEGDRKALLRELEKVKELSKRWNVGIPKALRTVSRQCPSKRLGDFLERMAYAIEADEDPKVFFRNEQEAVMEEYRSRYNTTMDRLEIVREIYVSLISVTMFLNVMLVVLSLLVGINHFLMSFLVVFIFIIVEVLLWMVINGTLPRESIWFDPKPRPLNSRFHRRIRISLIVGVSASLLLLVVNGLVGFQFKYTLLHLAVISTPLLLPGILVMMEEGVIIRRDQAFGAFIRTLGGTAETRGGAPISALKRMRWHDYGALTGQIKDLYDRLLTRIDSTKAWALFVKESRSELISQFLITYQEGIKAGGSPKDVSTLVSGFFTAINSLRKKRYLMADNFTALLYGLTVFISAGMFMIYQVVVKMVSKLNDLTVSSEDVESFQGLVLLKDTSGLTAILLAAVILVILLHVIFSADAARRFRGGHPLTLLLHAPMLLWTAALSAFIALWSVNLIL